MNLLIYCQLFLNLIKIRKCENNNPTLWDLIDEETNTEILLENMDNVWKLLTIKEIELFEEFAKFIKNKFSV